MGGKSVGKYIMVKKTIAEIKRRRDSRLNGNKLKERLLTRCDKGPITVGANRVELAQLLQTSGMRTCHQHASSQHVNGI